MARDITAGMVTALESGVIRQCLLGRFDIVTDPLIAWTGPGTLAPSSTGDTALDGQIFVNAAPFIEMAGVTEDQGIGGPVSIAISGHDLDFDLLKQIVRDKRQWRGRSAWLWLALLNADEATVVANPMRIKTGVMTQMTVRRNAEGSTVTVTIDKDLGRARGVIWRWTDHVRLFPADTFSTYILKLANNPQGLPDPDFNPTEGDNATDDNPTDGDPRGW